MYDGCMMHFGVYQFGIELKVWRCDRKQFKAQLDFVKARPLDLPKVFSLSCLIPPNIII